MAIQIESLLWALGVGLLVWPLVVPLISRIPENLEQAWQAENLRYSASNLIGEEISRKDLSLRFKIIYCLAASFISLLLFQILGVVEWSIAMVLYTQGLLLLAVINWRSSLLPDKLVLPLLWIGLLFNAYHGSSVPQIYGAALGFCVPWVTYWVFKMGTGREIVGYGDMKTFAMTGAWFGIDAMPTVFFTFLIYFPLTYLPMKYLESTKKQYLPSGYVPSGIAHLVASLICIMGFRIV